MGRVDELGLIDIESEVKACCMLCLHLWDFYWGVLCGVCMKSLHFVVAWLLVVSRLLPAERCECWPMPFACHITWLWACPTLAHTHVHRPAAMSCPPS